MSQSPWTLIELASIGTDHPTKEIPILGEEWPMQVLMDKHAISPIPVQMHHASYVEVWTIGPTNAQIEEDNST